MIQTTKYFYNWSTHDAIHDQDDLHIKGFHRQVCTFAVIYFRTGEEAEENVTSSQDARGPVLLPVGGRPHFGDVGLPESAGPDHGDTADADIHKNQERDGFPTEDESIHDAG